MRSYLSNPGFVTNTQYSQAECTSRRLRIQNDLSMNHEPLPQKILVPQGAEYKAVCRGLSHVKGSKRQVLPIPIGPKPLAEYLEQWQQSEDYRNEPPFKILVMGLCGSLSPQLVVGDIVVYQGCVSESDASTARLRSCDEELTTFLHNKLEKQAPLVKALTCDRIIVSAQEKYHLGQLYDTQVVDMEGYAALETLAESGVAVAMVRVVSDDSHHNLPNLTSALSPDGSLRPLPLAIGLMQQPLAATRLIRGAIHGLRVLQSVTTKLFSS